MSTFSAIDENYAIELIKQESAVCQRIYSAIL